MASQAAELKMPQAAASQREPSMEEILASIRRIIEDSDQVRKPEDMLLAEAPAHDAEPEPMDMIAANAPGSSFDLPGKMRVSREEPTVVAHQPDFTAPSELPQSQDAVLSETSPFARQSDPDLLAAEPVEHGRMFDDDDAVEPVMMEKTYEPVATERMETASAAQPVPAQVEKASLISERTGRQVAAAFGELSEAFEASRRKSFDELAAEMMRPMLQDWLDNNLPTLVEKLVREEIERVARGGR